MSDDDKKIIKLAERDDRASTWSVEDMLNQAKEVVKEEPQYKKALLILLDDEEGNYRTRPLCAGIARTSEVIMLLEIEKLRQMRDIDP